MKAPKVATRASLRWWLTSKITRGEDCWDWRTKVIVPRLRIGGRQMTATHAAWYVGYGCWPETTTRVTVARACGNLRCYRPRHLALIPVPEQCRLRSLRLERAEWRRCERCERQRWVRRSWRAFRFCSVACYRSVA